MLIVSLPKQKCATTAAPRRFCQQGLGESCAADQVGDSNECATGARAVISAVFLPAHDQEREQERDILLDKTHPCDGRTTIFLM
jgi:hypothetical protein